MTSGITDDEVEEEEDEVLDNRLKFATFKFDDRVGSTQDANGGDEVQGFPGLQFLPYLDKLVDREKMAEFEPGPKGRNTLIFGNAWYGSPNIQWPPSASLNILLFSLHFGERFKKKVKSKKSRAYLQKTNKALGARDLETLKFLEKTGVPAYFSGCATLLLDPS